MTGVILLLFVSSWGTVLGAAFCSHMALSHSCCRAKDGHSSISHDEMGDTQMESISQETGDAKAFASTEEACAHCLIHPQLPATGATLRGSNQAKRSVEIAAPPATTLVAIPGSPFLPAVSSRPHAPPGATASLHVLIGLFRI
jgi:hypothetical protein